jgi:hypothetical protein
MQRFRSTKTLQKFSSVHAQVHNHFNQPTTSAARIAARRRASLILPMQKSVAAMFFSLPRHALSAHLQVGRSPAGTGLRRAALPGNREKYRERRQNRPFLPPNAAGKPRISKAFQPDSLLDLTGSRTEENREALSDYRERLLKRRPFRVRVRSAPPEARHCVSK